MINVFPPVCETLSVRDDCPGECSQSSWYVSANLISGYGAGIPSVTVLQGNGKLNTSSVFTDTGLIVTAINYNSSCCFKDLELIAKDAVGNVVTCFKSLRATAAPSVLSYGAQMFLILPVCLWLNMEISL